MEQKHQVIMASSSANCKYKNITPSKNAKKTHSNSYNTFHHIKSEETKNGYQQQFHEKFCKIKCTSKGNIRSSITNGAATETIGFSKNKNYRIHNLVERLSNQQEEFRLCISTTVINAIH